MSRTHGGDGRRTINEGRRVLFGEPTGVKARREIAFVCECSRGSCYDAVLLTGAQYDEQRPGPILAEGHRGYA